MQIICKTKSIGLVLPPTSGFYEEVSGPLRCIRLGVSYLKWESGDAGVSGEVNRSLKSGDSRIIRESLTCPKQPPTLYDQEKGA